MYSLALRAKANIMNISDGFPEPPEASVLFTRFDFLFTLLRTCIMQRESNNCTGLFVLLCFFFGSRSLWPALTYTLSQVDYFTNVFTKGHKNEVVITRE
jgi:hypothetical protein